MQYIFNNVAFLDYKPFLFYHNSIFPKKRQEHAQKKKKVTTERIKTLKNKNTCKKKVPRIIIMMIIIELFIQYNPSIQKYCYQQGPFDYD